MAKVGRPKGNKRKEEKLGVRWCSIFKCRRKQSRICCADCREREGCDIRCRNDPRKCGKVQW